MSEEKKTTGKVSKKRPKPEKAKQSRKTRPHVVPQPTDPDVEVIQAPSGFRVVSLSQALREYARPVLEASEPEHTDEWNERLRIAEQLWNHGRPDEPSAAPKPSKDELIHTIGSVLKIGNQEAAEFFKKMIERKSFLFPGELQPEGFPFSVMRKEIRHLIVRFDQEKLNLSDKPVVPDADDRRFARNLKKLDSFIVRGADYHEYEDILIAVLDDCHEAFSVWLIVKEVADEVREDLAWIAVIFCRFVYEYLPDDDAVLTPICRDSETAQHDDEQLLSDPVILKSIHPWYLGAFLTDFVIRKVAMEPHAYPYVPSSLKLFCRFLTELGYVENPAPIMAAIDEIEPDFIEILRVTFG